MADSAVSNTSGANASDATSDAPVLAPVPQGGQASARLIEYARDRYAALPPHTTQELIENPVAQAVPGGAYYSYGLLAWQGRRVPLLDLQALLRAHAVTGGWVAGAAHHALVVAYQSAPGKALEYGAVALTSLPQTIGVSDADACALPADSDLWPLVALSCFQYQGNVVPVLDTARLFGAYLG